MSNNDAAKRMLGYLPQYYQTSRVMNRIVEGQGAELNDVLKALNGVLNQFFINTCTWKLDLWETELGLPVLSGQPVAERRDKIISRLHGLGTVTLTLVKELAETYEQGTIDITQDHSNYVIVIYFVDISGVPLNIDDLKEAIRAVVPAHLDIQYSYKYFIWDELDAKDWTWDELDALNLTWDELEVYQ